MNNLKNAIFGIWDVTDLLDQGFLDQMSVYAAMWKNCEKRSYADEYIIMNILSGIQLSSCKKSTIDIYIDIHSDGLCFKAKYPLIIKRCISTKNIKRYGEETVLCQESKILQLPQWDVPQELWLER